MTNAFTAGSPGDRVAGGLLGLLVGDALGVPYEFNAPESIPPEPHIEMAPPDGFRSTYPQVPPGTWSDDGAQALVLLDTLVHRGGLDLPHFASGLLRWREQGFYAVDGQVFDIGIQTAAALDRLAKGAPPEQAGPSGERNNGNGSLMRVLPLALWMQGTDQELARAAAMQSLPTHGHPRSAVACAFHCILSRRLLQGDALQAAWESAARWLRAEAGLLEFPREEVETVLDPASADQVKGSGYVVDSLWSARHCLQGAEDFEGAVRRAVMLGHDTDTTAAIAGGLAGVRFGLAGIPTRWIDILRGKEMVAPLLDALVRRTCR